MISIQEVRAVSRLGVTATVGGTGPNRHPALSYALTAPAPTLALLGPMSPGSRSSWQR
jgi:hypothetical protein